MDSFKLVVLHSSSLQYKIHTWLPSCSNYQQKLLCVLNRKWWTTHLQILTMNFKLVLSLVTISIWNTEAQEQVYFPDEEAVSQFISNEAVAAAAVATNISRSSADYESHVTQIIARGITTLTLAVDKAITDGSRNRFDNIVFAPVSIAAALALVLLGSNGKTFEELTTIMGLATGVDIQTKSLDAHAHIGKLILKLQTTSGFNIGRQVTFATAVFVQNDYAIRSLYKSTAEELYESEVLNVDFMGNSAKAQQIVNAWVSDRTKGKIKDILSDAPSEQTKVIIASAMYFKAEWEKPFFDGTTRRRPFFTNGRKSNSDIEVEMMSNGGVFPYFKDLTLNCEVMGFPYKGNQSTMYVVMPFNSNKQVLKDLERRLTTSEIERLVNSVKYTPSVILFPKMKIESTIDLKQSLEAIGVKSLFNPREANLALLSPGIVTPTLHTPARLENTVQNPIAVQTDDDDDSLLIFSRLGDTVNCTQIFQPNSTISTCQELQNTENRQQQVSYKKFGNKVGRRITPARETLDNIRLLINQQSTTNYQNPGLYADKVIHKVYMDITESGTEAAAATSVSLSRDGGRVTFRVDVPFFFFIMHEETKSIMFWGSVNTPTPNFKI